MLPTSSTRLPSNDGVYMNMGDYRPVSEDGVKRPRYLQVSSDSFRRISNIKYEVGDKVHYSKDKKSDREWTIVSSDDDKFTLSTEDTDDLPNGALVGENTNTVTVTATKLEIYKASKSLEILENNYDPPEIYGQGANEMNNNDSNNNDGNNDNNNNNNNNNGNNTGNNINNTGNNKRININL